LLLGDVGPLLKTLLMSSILWPSAKDILQQGGQDGEAGKGSQDAQEGGQGF